MVLLQTWMRKWELNENLIYKKAAEHQAIFVRDDVGLNLLKSRVFIVSTHMSKSCVLPVYYIKMMNGVKVIMRGNFYDWKLSVELPYKYKKDVNLIPEDCMSNHVTEGGKYSKIPDCYLEGFKSEWAWDAYNPNDVPTKFTIECPDEYRVYVVLHALKNAFPNVEYHLEDNKRTKEDIVKSIEKIYDDNGFNEYETVTDWGKQTQRKLSSGWEILWKTYCKMYDIRYEDNTKCAFDAMDVCEEPEKMADFILKYPTVYQAFCTEESMFEEIKY